MKRTLLISFIFICLSHILMAQEESVSVPNYIRGGFYLRVGPVIPVETYSEGQKVSGFTGTIPDTLYFPPAKLGAGMDLGFLIYFGPSFANKKIRIGMDASFFSSSFNGSEYTTMTNDSEDRYKYWYYYVGQKFGPLITINPVDRLMIDLSFKLNAFVSWHNDTWGHNILQKEAGLNIRYRVMMFSFMYNFGHVNYNDFSGANSDRNVENNTIRVMFGVKF